MGGAFETYSALLEVGPPEIAYRRNGGPVRPAVLKWLADHLYERDEDMGGLFD